MKKVFFLTACFICLQLPANAIVVVSDVVPVTPCCSTNFGFSLNFGTPGVYFPTVYYEDYYTPLIIHHPPYHGGPHHMPPPHYHGGHGPGGHGPGGPGGPHHH